MTIRVTNSSIPILLTVFLLFLQSQVSRVSVSGFDLSALGIMSFGSVDESTTTTTTTPKPIRKKYRRRRILKFVSTTVEEEEDCRSTGGSPCKDDSQCCLGKCNHFGFCPTAKELLDMDAANSKKRKETQDDHDGHQGHSSHPHRNSNEGAEVEDVGVKSPPTGRRKKVKPHQNSDHITKDDLIVSDSDEVK